MKHHHSPLLAFSLRHYHQLLYNPKEFHLALTHQLSFLLTLSLRVMFESWWVAWALMLFFSCVLSWVSGRAPDGRVQHYMLKIKSWPEDPQFFAVNLVWRKGIAWPKPFLLVQWRRSMTVVGWLEFTFNICNYQMDKHWNLRSPENERHLAIDCKCCCHVS